MIPDGWKIEPLGKLARVQGGNAFKSELFGTDGLPVVRISSIKDGAVTLQDAPLHPYDANLERFELADGDVLIAMSGATTGKLGRYRQKSSSERAYLNQRVGRFLPVSGDRRDLDFCWYVLQTERVQAAILGDAIGGAQPNVSGGEIERILVKVPPTAERALIAEALQTWDRVINTVEGLIANARTQKQALMQSLLTGKKRLPGFSGAWKHERIADVSTRVSRRNDGSPLPVLTISSTSGFVRQDEKYSRFMAGKSVESYIMLRKGEFAYNKGNSKTYEFGCVFDLEDFECGLVPHVYVCFRLKADYSHRFYKALFEADYLAAQLGRLVNTGVRNNGLLNITPAQFLGTKVPVPPLDEQDAIAAVMEAASGEVRQLEVQLAALREEKSALMQQLLTGKRRVKVNEVEVA